MRDTNLLHEALEFDFTYIPSKRFSGWDYSNFVLPNVHFHDGFSGVFVEFKPRTHSFLLSREQEQSIFIQFNYLKRKCQMLVRSYNRHRNQKVARTLKSVYSQVKEIESFLVKANVGVLISFAYKKNHVCPQDLIADAIPSLLSCVRKFNVDKGNKFSTYLVRAIFSSFGDTGEREARRCKLLELDHCRNVHSNMSHVDDLAKEEMILALHRIIKSNAARLTDNEMMILNGYYFENMFLDDLGGELKLTKERIRQIRVRAEAKLREVIPIDII